MSSVHKIEHIQKVLYLDSDMVVNVACAQGEAMGNVLLSRGKIVRVSSAGDKELLTRKGQKVYLHDTIKTGKKSFLKLKMVE